MIPFSSDGAATPRPSSILSRPVLDARMLGAQIGRRRTALAALEAEAIGTGSRTGAPADPAGWDRATWHSYLAAAMRLEARYGPRMRRLRQEIGQLERLMSLPDRRLIGCGGPCPSLPVTVPGRNSALDHPSSKAEASSKGREAETFGSS